MAMKSISITYHDGGLDEVAQYMDATHAITARALQSPDITSCVTVRIGALVAYLTPTQAEALAIHLAAAASELLPPVEVPCAA
jgi:hypothetical protein